MRLLLRCLAITLVVVAVIIMSGCSQSTKISSDYPFQSTKIPVDAKSALGKLMSAVKAEYPLTKLAQSLSEPGGTTFATPTRAPVFSNQAQNAQHYLRNGDITAALDICQQLIAEEQPSEDDWLIVAEVQLAANQFEQARDGLRALLQNSSDEALRSRATFLLATAELSLNNWSEAARLTERQLAPDGLGDALALLRARAAMGRGDVDAVKGELNRAEMRSSSNRVLLKEAAQLATQIDDNELAGELFAMAGRYPDWAINRSQTLYEAAKALEKAGKNNEAIQQYRFLIEEYTWTVQAADAWWALGRLHGSTPYHTGLIEAASGRNDMARAAFQDAARGGTYADAAQEQLRQLEVRIAWQETSANGSPEAYRAFRERFPDSSQAAEAWFQDGFVHYRAEHLEEAAQVWNEGAGKISGDASARLHLWCYKALTRLGQEKEATDHLKAASQTQPTGYYTVRAKDLLNGTNNWPSSGTIAIAISEAERQETKSWLDSWLEPSQTQDWSSTLSAQRTSGLLTLGLIAEAAAEADGWVSSVDDPRLLVSAAETLSAQELWASATKAADKALSFSPIKNIDQAPSELRKLCYPVAYNDLIKFESKNLGLGQILLLALIRQESGYDPWARSPVEARGLTQIMPSTADFLAATLGWTNFTQEDLNHPAIAVEFGAYYLADQLNNFGGNAFEALAAYNAGAEAVGSWNSSDNDLFVELIDYAETKDYVRQVYLHHAIYRSLSAP